MTEGTPKPLEIVGFTFARGGSKGVPGKNIRNLGGKPLIAYSLELGLSHPLISRMIVSTDDEKIAEVGRQYGAEVPFLRPQELASDTANEWDAWRHAVTFVEQEKAGSIDIFVSLPAVCPLRSFSDVTRCVELFLEGDADIVITVTPSSVHPSLTMVSLDEQQMASILLPPENKVYRRQDVNPVFNIVACVYVTTKEYIMNNSGLFSGRVKAVCVPNERAVDIDTELDFQFAEFLVSQK